MTPQYHEVPATTTGPQNELEEVFYLIEHLPNPGQPTLPEASRLLADCLKRAEPGLWVLTVKRLEELWPQVNQ